MEPWTLYIIAGAGVITLIVLISGIAMRCPSCRKWWSSKNIGRKELGREGGYKTVTHYDITRDRSGKEIGRTERKEQIHVTRITYQNYYQCKHCRHEWTTVSTSEHEG